MELDKSISYGNIKYNALLSIMASKLSYENEAFVKIKIKHHWNVSIIDMTKQIFAWFCHCYIWWDGYDDD